MAIYKLKRKNFSHLSTDRPDNHYSEAISKISTIPEPNKNCLSSKSAIIGAAVLSGIIALIQHFFSRGASKYRASAQEIEAIQSELPKEYAIMRKIQNEVINTCHGFIFSSRDSINFYCNILPSFLNLNGDEWIAGWARETGKKGLKWAPILSMYNSSFVFCYDFDKKYWFMVINGKEFVPKDGDIWAVMVDEFKRVKELAAQNLINLPDLLKQVNTYIDTNLKLIKKYGKV